VLCFVNNGLADKAQHGAWASLQCRLLGSHTSTVCRLTCLRRSCN